MGGKDDRMSRLEGDGDGGYRQTAKPDVGQAADPRVNVFYPERGGPGIELAAVDASGAQFGGHNSRATIRGIGAGRFTAA